MAPPFQFVPRALRLKGVREPANPPRKRPPPKVRSCPEDRLCTFVEQNEVTSSAAPPTSDEDQQSLALAFRDKTTEADTSNSQDQIRPRSDTAHGSKHTEASVTEDYLAQIVCGVDLLFTDYAIQSRKGSKWLKDHYQHDPRGNEYIAIKDIVDHPYIDRLRPTPTEALIRRALQEKASMFLEISEDGTLVRRNPFFYPYKFTPENSFSEVDDSGVTYWHQKTVYIEPHDLTLVKNPAKFSWYLQTQVFRGDIWLPIQHILPMHKSCAFVVTTRNVVQQEAWTHIDIPISWKVMSWVEHKKRTEEYLEILQNEKEELEAEAENEVKRKNGSQRKRGGRIKKKRKHEETSEQPTPPVEPPPKKNSAQGHGTKIFFED
ncbi:hypothetical protein BCR34DRAFT_606275 [Clohesyomyces aquaticus]|uniref:Uncharacterized protein n=1 Tax=Clohesyomyces aquaticus TaxID=1231657 RepID=A0A1Y1YS31_9PLEO|nr:hypothetical protein BCR34DRAFT_606275 [Clohesyomyces aquaticus]